MKANCLLIGATKYNYREVNPSPVKYSLLSLMSHVLDIADVEVIDFEMRCGYPRTLDEIERFKEYVKSVLKEKSPDIVAISCYTSFDYLATIDILKICRMIHPNATLVVGGYHATALPEDFLGENMYADYIIRGEGEVALRKIINSAGKNLPQIITGENLELSQEKPLRYDLYPYKTNELYISLSRGCFHKCSFCVQSDDYENRYRKMDLDNIKEKIDQAVKDYPIRRLLFSDPIFGIDYNQTEQLVNFLSEKYPNYTYWAETRIDRLTEELVACLSRLKIDLHFGVESLAEDTLLNLMEKTKNPQYYNECFFKAVELCQKYKVLGLFGFIMNYPGEQVESSKFTLDRIGSIVNKYDKLNVTFHINQYALYPGNKIYTMRNQLHEERGFTFDNDGWWRSNKPNIRARSEDCIASTSLKEAYNGDIHYWHAKKAELLRGYTSRFDLKAYNFYQREEVYDIVDSYDKTIRARTDYEQIHEVIAKHRYILTDMFYSYSKKLKDKTREFVKAFEKLFIYATYDNNNLLIKDYLGGKSKEIMNQKMAEIEEQLKAEYDKNVVNLEKDDKSCTLVFSSIMYQIDEFGKIRKQKE